jgi:type II secretory ATPase GspE/PulE/Tfp pilus assembly ATPase PilB-like protein
MAEETTEGVRTLTGLEPVPDPLHSTLVQADDERATDIHLDPVEDGLVLRFRVDGIVHLKKVLPLDVGKRLQNQIRVTAGLDIEKLFRPEEARIRWVHQDEEHDLRVVVVPTGDREATHLRLLHAEREAWALPSLGLSEADQEKVKDAVRVRNGLVLVGGQTGTGKTTTLYSLVSALDLETTVAVSIEDPVEFQLPLLRQLGVDPENEVTIFSGLRTLLRADPDVILIGEIRDQQSAITAARAALAGRLVLASIHAADVASAVEAMHYLSVPYHILGGSLHMALAQNLVRKVCPDCATTRKLKDQERALFEKEGVEAPADVPKAQGCDACKQYGYIGRTGVFETMVMDKGLANFVTDGPQLEALRERIRERGVQSLLADALGKVADGVTTMEEVFQFYWPAREA